MATEEKSGSGVLVEQWPTVLWRSSANWAAWLSVLLPDIIAWALSHLDMIPSELLSPENKNIARIVLVSIAVPLARIWKQRALRRAVAEKGEATNAN